MDTISGSVERVTYYNQENGYSVVRLKPEDRRIPGLDREGMATITGNLPELAPGEYLRLQGKWINHPNYGMQFSVEVCEQTLPATLAGIRRYLGSGLIKGIGTRLADRIVNQFGMDTLDVIEANPIRLQEVPDIGKKRMRLIISAWQEQKQVKEIMIFLHSHNVSTNLAVKVYKQYGEQSLTIVQEDPYRLAQDIHGVGFKTADRIAQALGLPPDHSSRLEAGIVYVLNQMSNEGHVFSPEKILFKKAAELLDQPPEMLKPALEKLQLDQRVELDHLPVDSQPKDSENQSKQIQESGHPLYEPVIYLTPFFFSERSVAERLASLHDTIPTRLSDLPPAFQLFDTQLSSEQLSAIRSTSAIH